MKTVKQMTINQIQDQIISEFLPLKEWMDKYQYLIQLGKNHPDMTALKKTETNKIPGCQSKVWLNIQINDNETIMSADSDALITRGILALILKVFNHQPPRDILNSDLYFIRETGLSKNLSPSRANGLESIIRQIKKNLAV